jgi:TPR repeat protein
VKLTFPNDRWQVFTEPPDGMPWNTPTEEDPSYHVLVAVTNELLVFQLTIEPIVGGEVGLDAYLIIVSAMMATEMAKESLSKDFELIESKVVERRGRRVGLIVFGSEGHRFFSSVFAEKGRFVILTFNCLEGLCESRKDQFWAIADSYERLGASEETAASVPKDLTAPARFIERPETSLGDHTEAVRRLRKAAEQGHAAAQSSLGWMYEQGRGVPKDEKEAARWYRAAAEQGDAQGQFLLALMYRNGRGVAQDHAQALTWCRKAAEQGYAMAQNDLGVMYANGRGVVRDDAEAVKWYRKAAEQGGATAQVNLGLMYASGRGIERDDIEAVKWYRKAAEQGYARAQNNLGFMYETGRGVAQDDAEAVKWYRKAAEQGYASAKNNLGSMYEQGRAVPGDEKEAAR